MTSRVGHRAEPAEDRRHDGRSAGAVAWRVLMLAGVLAIAVGMLYLRTFPPTATVMSDSMEPKIAVGDIVLFKATGGAPPSVGDVVEIKVHQELQQKHDYPSAVIHRVVAVNDDGTVTTKGDNLDSEDPFHAEISSIQRKVVFTIPMAGRALGFLFSPFGLLWIGLGVLIFVVMPFYDVQRQRSALQQAEVASLAELQAKIDRATTWTIQTDGRVAAYAPHGPPPGDDDQSYRTPFAPSAAGPAGRHGEPRVMPPDADVKDRLEELVSAVGDYGYHLRSHTEILKSMSEASRDLADVVARLQRDVIAPTAVEPIEVLAARVLVAVAPTLGQDRKVVVADAVAARTVPPMTRGEVITALHHLAVTGSIQLEPAAPGVYRCRAC